MGKGVEQGNKGGRRVAAHVCAVINNPNAVFDSCVTRNWHELTFVGLYRDCLSRCTRLEIRDSSAGESVGKGERAVLQHNKNCCSIFPSTSSLFFVFWKVAP